MYICIKKLTAAFALVAFVTSAYPMSVSAQVTETEEQNINKIALFGNQPIKMPLLAVNQPTPVLVPEPVKPIEYVVVEGDYLDKIATDQKTTWLRIWQKNTNIQHPDKITVGDKFIIPTPEEVLVDRALPEPPQAPVVVPSAPATQTPVFVASASTQPVYRGSTSNTYSDGYCTWYVKDRRPDIPNMWGNANRWLASAQAAGYATGSQPRTGAIGVSFTYYLGHVVYVESVNGDGTVTVSEMNFRGWNVQSTRTTSASEFVYIY